MNRNIRWKKSDERVVINDYECEATRYTFMPADLTLMFAYLARHNLLWAVGVSFRLPDIFVDNNSIEEFENLCKDLSILLYTEEMLDKIAAANRDRKTSIM